MRLCIECEVHHAPDAPRCSYCHEMMVHILRRDHPEMTLGWMAELLNSEEPKLKVNPTIKQSVN